MTKSEITKGTTYKLCVEVQNDDGTIVDLSGYSGRMAIRHHYNDVKIVDAEVAIEIPNKIIVMLSSTVTSLLNETNLYGTLEIIKEEEVILIEQFEFQIFPNTNL